jgi:hypothetical protein
MGAWRRPNGAASCAAARARILRALAKLSPRSRHPASVLYRDAQWLREGFDCRAGGRPFRTTPRALPSPL